MATCSRRFIANYANKCRGLRRWFSSFQENGINDCPRNCLCSNNIEFDYKNTRLLSQFVSEQTARILPRTITQVCLKQQRKIAAAIKLSRDTGFFPYMNKLPQYLRDPSLFSKF